MKESVQIKGVKWGKGDKWGKRQQNTPSVEETRAVETLAAFFQGLLYRVTLFDIYLNLG